MEIAAEHAEAVGERAGVGMEERFLLDGIALRAPDIAPRHQQPASLVVADLADANSAVGQRAAMPAGDAL